jgi:pantoate--beta-alanine ligase
VTTVVAKLFNIVQPTAAVFGEKDYQQAAVVNRMVRDLNMPIRMIVAPTVREPDGLAMSSRNKYLSAAERIEARTLSTVIKSASAMVRRGKGAVPTSAIVRMVRQRISKCRSARLDYVTCFDPETLAPVRRAGKGTRMALAVWIGRTRLIDNGRL